ncbi:hypothetical protein KUL97_01225 [Synechococcus sp. HK05]|uniref:hypothetical protein n=1 Tax=Synechococcus sp. HK05 TaxID=2725975 RepID=UPI001C3806E9|nr:hypothetical protein [Synechococcus sp. HK05]MBV2350323.1 hypothetical protein [Synechococcus sp. HK05]
MAVASWISEVCSLDLRKSIALFLVDAGFTIDEDGTTERQVSAFCWAQSSFSRPVHVKLVAAWSDVPKRYVWIEVSSDESMLLPGTLCDQCGQHLMQSMPPI